MTQRFNFTRARLEKLEPADKTQSVYDDGEPGMCMLITPNNARTFYLYRKIEGRPERIKLGRFPDIDIDQARAAARVHKGKEALGQNPAADRRKMQGGLMLGEVFDRYIADYAKPRKRTWKEDENLFRRYVEPWRPRRINRITKPDVQQLHTEVGRTHGHYGANRMLSMLRKVFNFAPEIGYTGDNPCSKIQPFAETSRERFIQPDEMSRFFAALEDEPDETWRDFFKFSLFAGSRRSNTQSAEWKEINFSTRVWEVPASKAKAKKPIRITLSDPAMEILQRRWKSRTPDCPWVFPAGVNKSTSGHVIEPKHAWKRILAAAQIEDLRVHDLRRTLGSWMSGSGANTQMIGKQLGHGDNSRATAVYARLNLEPVATAVDIAAAAMVKAASHKPGNDSGASSTSAA